MKKILGIAAFGTACVMVGYVVGVLNAIVDTAAASKVWSCGRDFTGAADKYLTVIDNWANDFDLGDAELIVEGMDYGFKLLKK
jgi:hypothetical protein